MSFPSPLDLATGNARGWSVVHKFGHNNAVGTTFVPVSAGGVYRTPQPAGATPLRIAGGNVADTAAGSGARAVTLIGLDATGTEITETLATAGTSASAATSQSFIRLYRAFVSDSGTYASQTAGSHAAAITIEDAAGSEDWAIIAAYDFPHGQSQIGMYSVPLGYEAFVTSIEVQAASTKVVDFNFYQRQNILQAAPPYHAMRLVRELIGIEGDVVTQFQYPLGPYPALTDIGFMSKVSSSTAEVSVDFTILLRRVD